MVGICIDELCHNISFWQHTKMNEFNIYQTFELENDNPGTMEKNGTYAIRSQVFECKLLNCFHNCSLPVTYENNGISHI